MSSSLQPIGSAAMRDVIQERDDALARVAALEDRLRARPSRVRKEAAEAAEGVSVVIPVYQDHRFLDGALASVVAQTVQPLEVIVIDDGSHRPQGEAIRALARKYGADYYRVTNRSLPNARNAGLMLAKGHAFLPLDADDAILPTYIEKTLPLLEDADVVLTGLQEHGPDRNGCYMPGYDRHYTQVTADLILTDYNRFYYCSLLRVSILKEVGGYNGRLGGGWILSGGGYEDMDLWIDLLKRGARFAAVQEALFSYRTRADGMLAAAEQNRATLLAEIRRHHADH